MQDGVSVEYVRAGTFVGFPWFHVGDLLRVFRERRPHFILAFGPSPYDPIAASIFTLLGCPFVQVYHADFNDKKLATRVVTWLHNVVALRLASAIICTNQRMLRALGRRGFSGRAIAATPGIDDVFFSKMLAGPERESALLFVGALDDGHKYKRLDILLNAISELRREGHSVYLSVVGDGNRRPYFEQLSNEMGLADCVEFLGGITDDELALRYALTGALILPSPTTQEGFGLVCLEAMAAGAPVVCSKNAGAAQIVRDAPAGALWDGQDIGDLKLAIVKVQRTTPAEREELRTYARGYGWDEMCEQLLAELAIHLPTVPFTRAE
jgi:glycosyltransferase involved in cell wall biosynthesis